MKIKTYVIYVKKSFVIIKTRKSLKITVITPENLEDHSVCNLRYKVPKEIPTVFYNDSTYDYHFLIKKLAKGFEGELNAQRKIQKNILIFHCRLKKKIVMVKNHI